jgi:type VI secretion system secreted protein Hcp
MSAFVKIGDIQGEVTDEGHKDWIHFESMSSPIHRSIPQGAKDQQRTKGETSLGDIVLVRQVDKSSPKLAEACATGVFYPEVEMHFCSTLKNKEEPYFKYKLKNVVVTSYSFHGNQSGEPLPSEEVTLGFTDIEWTYVEMDNETGAKKGNVVGKYNPAKGKA